MSGVKDMPNDLVSVSALSDMIADAKRDSRRSRVCRIYYYINKYKLDHYKESGCILVSESYFLNWYNNHIKFNKKKPCDDIMALLEDRAMTMRQLAKELGVSLGKVRYHFDRLYADGCIQKFDVLPTGGKGRNNIVYKAVTSGNNVSLRLSNNEVFSIKDYSGDLKITLDKDSTGRCSVSFTKEQLAAILATTVTYLKNVDIPISEFISGNISVGKIKVG